jgi:hypothetical protein
LESETYANYAQDNSPKSYFYNVSRGVELFPGHLLTEVSPSTARPPLTGMFLTFPCSSSLAAVAFFWKPQA